MSGCQFDTASEHSTNGCENSEKKQFAPISGIALSTIHISIPIHANFSLFAPFHGSSVLEGKQTEKRIDILIHLVSDCFLFIMKGATSRIRAGSILMGRRGLISYVRK